MTKVTAFTDADVAAIKQPILDNFHPPSDRWSSWHIRPEEMARAILEAIAPVIAARALRECAEPMITYCPTHNPGGIGVIESNCDWCASLGIDQEWVERLRDRADKIEGAL